MNEASVNFVNELPNFDLQEFKCDCGCGKREIRIKLVIMLQAARYLSPVPFRIISGIRCKEYNKKIGGTQDSSHITGWAVDLKLVGNSSNMNHEREIILNALRAVGFNRIGINRTTIHVDCDPSKPASTWHYYER